MASQWPAPSPDCYLNIDAPPAVTLVRLPLLLLSGVVHHRGGKILETPHPKKSTMSSLLKPFSVCEGPCESSGVRRGCPSSAPHQQPPSRRLAAATALGSLSVYQHSYAAKRNLAAAAAGGRKITHPGKAILAGNFVFATQYRRFLPSQPLNAFCTAQPNLNLSPIDAIHAELGQNAPAVMRYHLHDVVASIASISYEEHV